jgi:hypothetical protein
VCTKSRKSARASTCNQARRGEGLYPQLLAGAARRLAPLGIGRVLIFVDERNRNSVRAHVAGGARPVAHFAAASCFGWVRIVDGRDGSARWLAPGRWYDTVAERVRTGA